MWDLPGPGLEPMSPALAGGFLTTVPPGKSFSWLLYCSWSKIQQNLLWSQCTLPEVHTSGAQGKPEDPWIGGWWRQGVGASEGGNERKRIKIETTWNGNFTDKLMSTWINPVTSVCLGFFRSIKWGNYFTSSLRPVWVDITWSSFEYCLRMHGDVDICKSIWIGANQRLF